MSAVTWTNQSNSDLDILFENLREQQYNNTEDKYWRNYSLENFGHEVVAKTIYFDPDGKPALCSSICKKDVWPANTYRILNRTWKTPTSRYEFPPGIGNNFADTVRSQLQWLRTNTQCQLYFCSRQKDGWQNWAIKNFIPHNLYFETDEYKYLTCTNPNDDTCWQTIIYSGNKNLLESWPRCKK